MFAVGTCSLLEVSVECACRNSKPTNIYSNQRHTLHHPFGSWHLFFVLFVDIVCKKEVHHHNNFVCVCIQVHICVCVGVCMFVIVTLCVCVCMHSFVFVCL